MFTGSMVIYLIFFYMSLNYPEQPLEGGDEQAPSGDEGEEPVGEEPGQRDLLSCIFIVSTVTNYNPVLPIAEL